MDLQYYVSIYLGTYIVGTRYLGRDLLCVKDYKEMGRQVASSPPRTGRTENELTGYMNQINAGLRNN